MTSSTQSSAGPALGPITARARKFLVVADGSPESRVAIRFGAGRAAHVTGGGLILFHAIAPGAFQHWMAVADRMREEATEEARNMLEEVAAKVFAYSGVMPEIVIREGQPAEALQAYVNEEEDLFIMILGAGTEGSPGPLVEYFSGEAAGHLPCPLMIVPGGMTDSQIDGMV